jgi:TolB-like protein/Tfp pilus assembly protein PilF
LLVGFPIAVIFSWIFDVTPEGIEITKPARELEKNGQRDKLGSWKIATYVCIIIIVGLILYNLFDARIPGGLEDPVKKSIAVLPFENRSGNDDDIYFTDGIHDQIISQLFKIGGLNVRGRTSVEHYRTSLARKSEIGDALQVQYILTGGVQRAGTEVRINVQLIEANSDDLIWAENFDRVLSTSNLLSVQSEIALEIASNLKLILTPEVKARIEERPIINLEAYQACMKGRYYLAKRTQNSIQLAQKFFFKAILLDSSYALAYSGLANTYTQLSGYGVLANSEAIPKSLEAASKAIALDPNLAEAHLAEAWAEFHLSKGNVKNDHKFRKSIELSPGYANTYHWYAWYMLARREFIQAENLMKKALDLDPLSMLYNASAGFLYNATGDLDRAISQLQLTLTIDSISPRAHSWIGQAYVLLGNFDKGFDHLIKAVEFSKRNPQYLSSLAWAYAKSGILVKSSEVIAEMVQMRDEKFVPNYDLALVHFGLDDYDSGMKYLLKSVESNDSWLLWVQVDPRFADVRDLPEFKAAIRQVWP